ncbi:MAG: hypothetical protein ACSHYA_06670 [Opitutaceae bacterium]
MRSFSLIWIILFSTVLPVSIGYAEESVLIAKPSQPDAKFQYRLIREVTRAGVLNSHVMSSSLMDYFLPVDSYWKLKADGVSSADFEFTYDSSVTYSVNLYKKARFLENLESSQLSGYLAWLRQKVESDPLRKLVLLNEESGFQPEVGRRALIQLDGSKKMLPFPGLTKKPFGKEQALIEYKIQNYNSEGILISEVGYLESFSEFDDFIYCALLESGIDKFGNSKRLFKDILKNSYLVESEEWLKSMTAE